MDAALIVFAKVPRAGNVKTRLTPVLTPSEAARLYESFLLDALEQYDDLAADVRLYFAPPVPENPLSGVPEDVTIVTQKGEGLGDRMKTAVRETLERGYDRAAIIGTDHPTLPIGFVRQSFAALEPRRSVCIGPSVDGGFYLLGMNAYYPQLFDGMTYRHDGVFSDTLSRVGGTDARLTVLPQWYDVDTPAMLERMVTDLNDTDVKAAHTRRMVEDLDLQTLATS